MIFTLALLISGSVQICLRQRKSCNCPAASRQRGRCKKGGNLIYKRKCLTICPYIHRTMTASVFVVRFCLLPCV